MLRVRYDVPDQSSSLPGMMSAASVNKTWDRKIGAVPVYITGPATRACGGCHKAELINEDSAGGLMVYTEHIKKGGYMVEGGKDANATLDSVIKNIMAVFK